MAELSEVKFKRGMAQHTVPNRDEEGLLLQLCPTVEEDDKISNSVCTLNLEPLGCFAMYLTSK